MDLTPGLLFDVSRSYWTWIFRRKLKIRKVSALCWSAEVQSIHGFEIHESTGSGDFQDPRSRIWFSEVVPGHLSLMASVGLMISADHHHSWIQKSKTTRRNHFSRLEWPKRNSLMSSLPFLLRLWRSLNQLLQILERHYFCLSRQFYEACDTWRSHWRHRRYRSCIDCGRGMSCAEACRRFWFDEVSGLSLDPKLGTDVIKKESWFINYESSMKLSWSIWAILHWKSSGYDRIHLSEHNCVSKNSRGWASWHQKTRVGSVDAWLVSDELLSKRKFWYSGTTAERIFIVLRVVRSSSRCQESSGSRNARNEGRCTVLRFYEWECHDRDGIRHE